MSELEKCELAKQKYNDLVENARKNPYDGYVERHHIIPRCLGGTNDVSNLVKLRGRDHFVAHQMLIEMFPVKSQEWVKMVYALHKMSFGRQKEKYDITPEEYEEIRIANSLALKGNPGGKCHLGKKYTPERLERAHKVLKSPEHRAKMSIAMKKVAGLPEVTAKTRHCGVDNHFARSVNQIDVTTGAIVNWYEMVTTAAIAVNVPHYKISYACRVPGKIVAGFYWKYAEDVE